MAAAKDIVDLAASFVGVKENPPDSNNVIFNTDYYGRHVYGAAYPWCCTFVWDIFRMAGSSELFYDGKKTAYCPEVVNWGRENDLIVPLTEGRPGYLILFDWNHDGVADHIAIIEKQLDKNIYRTIEGNTAVGNDSNGGEVMRRTRDTNTVCCIIRPRYQEEEKMSYEDFIEYMIRYNSELANMGVPQDKKSWQYQAWEFVTMSGISDGYRPYSPVTRVELWAMLRVIYQMISKTFGGKK